MSVCGACGVAYLEGESHVCQENPPLAGSRLAGQMAVLSVPSFLAITGYLLIWVLPDSGSSGSLSFFEVWLFALLVRLLTVPLAAVALVMGIRRRGLRGTLP